MCGSAEDSQLGRRGDLAPDRAGDGALRGDDACGQSFHELVDDPLRRLVTGLADRRDDEDGQPIRPRSSPDII